MKTKRNRISEAKGILEVQLMKIQAYLNDETWGGTRMDDDQLSRVMGNLGLAIHEIAQAIHDPKKL